MDAQRVGHAALTGWRKKAADAIAPRLPFDEKVRTVLGFAFRALTARFVLGTLGRARRGESG